MYGLSKTIIRVTHNEIYFFLKKYSICSLILRISVKIIIKKNPMIESFMDYLLFYVPLENLLYGDITIVVEKLLNLGFCSAFRVFEQGGIFIVPHLL
jgi:hypothetical protein